MQTVDETLERLSHATCTASERQGHHVTIYFNQLKDAQAFYSALVKSRQAMLTRIYGDAEQQKTEK